MNPSSQHRKPDTSVESRDVGAEWNGEEMTIERMGSKPFSYGYFDPVSKFGAREAIETQTVVSNEIFFLYKCSCVKPLLYYTVLTGRVLPAAGGTKLIPVSPFPRNALAVS